MAIPNPNTIPNSALVNFSYAVSPTITNSSSAISNTVTSQLNVATISSSKIVDKAFANVGDTLIYTVTIVNFGSTTADNIVFIDTIPNGTALVIGSFNQDGVVIVDSPNPPGTTLPNPVGPGALSTVTFQVTVNTIPNPNPIPNNATMRFTYTVNPSIPDGASSNLSTNTVNTQINNANISPFPKSVDRSSASVGSILTYTVTIANSGNVTANNVHFTDTLPNGTSFVTNSVILNGVSQPGAVVSPPTGVTVGNVNPGSIATLSFQLQVTTIPNPNPIQNTGFVTYNFVVNPVTGATVSGSNTSSTSSTLVGTAASLNLTKSSPKQIVGVGDIVSYTIALSNVGNATANNIVFIDTIPNGTHFVPNSLFLNGVPQPGQSPAPPGGFNAGFIVAGGTSTITFNVQVDTVPSPNPFNNSATTNFNYVSNPVTGATSPGSANSNSVGIFVRPLTTPIKFVDKQFGIVGDTLTYTITWQNQLNGPEENLVLYDTIPNDTTFVTDSVFINGVNQPGQSPAPPGGLSVGDLAIGNTVTITFQVTVNTIPSPNPIPNQALMQYTFEPDLPGSPIYTDTRPSNFVNTQINTATIIPLKSVNTAFAKVSDILTYTIALSNTGNVTATNILFIDTIPNNTSLVAGSFRQDNTIISGSPNPPGVTLPNQVAPGATSTITFQVTVNTIPTPNPIPNNATIQFNYTVNPSIPNGASSNISTNTVNTQINNPFISAFPKSVDKSTAQVGDILTYTVTITNSGNVTANNVSFTDTLANGTSLVPNSVIINGVIQPGAVVSPPTGVTIGNINPSSTTTLSFQVQINTIPSPNPIQNTGVINYSFVVNPITGTTAPGSSISSTASTQVLTTASLNLTKSSPAQIVNVGDIVSYTIALSNVGNATASNVLFIDTIPSGTSFVANSLFLNGIIQPGQSPNPPGFNAGSIAPGSTATITFNIHIDTVPSPNPFNNSATANFNYISNPNTGATLPGSSNSNSVAIFVKPLTTPIKSVDNQNASVGNTLTYTVTWTNSLNGPETNLILFDTISNGTTFVTNSVFVNGVNQPGVSPAPPGGLSLGTLNAGNTVTVTFQVTVTTIPVPNPIANQALMQYTFARLPGSPVYTDTRPSNIVNTQISLATISALKSVNTNFAAISDILTYTIALTNTGNVSANNILFIDTIPNGTSIVNGSFNQDNTSISGSPNPPGVTLPNPIGPGATSTVTFQVTVNTIPTPNPIPNNATIQFNYTINPSIPNGASSNISTNTVNTQINSPSFMNAFFKQVDKSVAQVGDILTYTITITNNGNVTANNVRFTDTVANGTSFVSNSIILNGVVQPGAVISPPTGVTIGNINPGSTTTLSFEIHIDTLPNPNPIQNTGAINYTFVVNPITGETAPGSALSSTSSALVATAAIVNLTKTASPIEVSVGDIVSYTVTIANTGTATANNMIFIDTIPNVAHFVPNSLFLNGVNLPGQSPNPPGFNAGSIVPGGLSTVTFNVQIDTVPAVANNPFSNIAAVNFVYISDPNTGATLPGTSNSNFSQVFVKPLTTPIKSVDKLNAGIGGTITYTITWLNEVPGPQTNLILYDTIPNGTTFVNNSVFVNGINQPGLSPAPPGGLPLGTLTRGNSVTVTFQVLVNTVPSPNPIPNQALMQYSFQPDLLGAQLYTDTRPSNFVNTQINFVTLGITKATDKTFATCKDIITYTLSIPNNGNVTATNVIVSDTVPNGTTFVPGSVLVNGIPTGSNPSSISVGSISPGATSTVSFRVQVQC